MKTYRLILKGSGLDDESFNANKFIVFDLIKFINAPSLNSLNKFIAKNQIELDIFPEMIPKCTPHLTINNNGDIIMGKLGVRTRNGALKAQRKRIVAMRNWLESFKDG